MLEDKDYVMRIVHEWIRTLIKLIFNKDIDRDEDAEIPLEMMEQFRPQHPLQCSTALGEGL